MPEVKDAAEAVRLAKKYAREMSEWFFWGSVIESSYDEEHKVWRVVFTAATGLLAPYRTYEVLIDATTGALKEFRRLDSHEGRGR
ncbi:MAG TPA: hypothetical protein ENF34_00610 [Candidatus Bathyarchaeota archaeon]|nr:hypothetical protein [Candidatus Bathyarchaeota archaeon]